MSKVTSMLACAGVAKAKTRTNAAINTPQGPCLLVDDPFSVTLIVLISTPTVISQHGHAGGFWLVQND